MARLIFTDINAAKEEAIHLQQENSQTYSIIEVATGFWVTRKRYAKQIKAKTLWDTVGKSPRARNSSRFWSDDEKQMVIDNYAKTGAKLIAPRLGKSADSVHSMAATLGIRHNKKQPLQHPQAQPQRFDDGDIPF